ncbi:hypothetical protein SAMD00019534_095120, partial [Acytostelium subglobosum LB1]|uniref:hypothetical protein n=1 Tax=Acytostelium subglobosum LB1 TaxID=1410327 RepID=UPI000644D7D5
INQNKMTYMAITNTTTSSDSTFTGSVATDKLMYTFWGIRIIIYIMFFIMNSVQTAFELEVVVRKRSVNTRFFTFLSMTLFCACKLV